MTLPKLAAGCLIWRPVIPHLLLGLTPTYLAMTQTMLTRHGVLYPDPVRGYAVWGDVDNLGAPPDDCGWRFSEQAKVGTPILFNGLVPPDWTHLKVLSLTRQTVDGRSRTCVRALPMCDGRQTLFNNALDWFNRIVAPSMSESSADAHRSRIFDQDLWALNWA